MQLLISIKHYILLSNSTKKLPNLIQKTCFLRKFVNKHISLQYCVYKNSKDTKTILSKQKSGRVVTDFGQL